MGAELHIEFCSQRMMSGHCWHATSGFQPSTAAAMPSMYSTPAQCCYCGDKRVLPYMLAPDQFHGSFKP